MNAGPSDWFFYCDGSPLKLRPTLDPAAARDPIEAGSVDDANRSFVRALARRLGRAGDD